MKTIKTMLDRICETYKDNTAFIVKENRKFTKITYEKVLSDVKRLAWGLAEKGLADKYIAVSGKNSYKWVISALAVFYSGNILVPIDGALPEGEFTRIIERSKSSALIYSNEIEEKSIIQNVPLKVNMNELESIFSDTEQPLFERDSEKIGILMFTSGTTSDSKAVMLSQKNAISNVESLMKWEKFTPKDVNLALLPLFHAFGLIATLLFMNNGMCSVFCEGLRLKKAFEDYDITVFVGVPLILDKVKGSVEATLKSKHLFGVFNALRAFSNGLRKIGIDLRGPLFKVVRKNLSKLRLIISGAAALSPETYNFFNDIGIVLIQGYGLTETAPVLSAENPENMRIGSIGKALPDIDIKIYSPDEDGIGEIIAKGPNVMLGYQGEDNSCIDENGYFHTGDLGYIDKDGYIFISGRKKNVLVLPNGKNVFPEETELLLGKIPGVKESVVYLSRDAKPVICAKIVYDEELTNPDILKEKVLEVNASLAVFKEIKKTEFTTEEFKKTTTGKIKRDMI